MLKRLAALLITVCLIAACSSKTGQGSKVLAIVNGTALTEQDLALSNQPTGHGMEERKVGLDYLITEELFYQQGIKLGLDKDPTYQKKLKELENMGHGTAKNNPGFKKYVASVMRDEMARRIFNTQIAAKIDIRLADAKEYYEKNKNTISTELHLGLLKYGTKEAADAALKQIRSGTSFETVAKAYEKGATKGTKPAWDLGYVPWEQIPIDFVEPLYRSKDGEVCGVLGTPQGGFQIVKVYGRRPRPGKADFSLLGTSVMNRLRDMKIIQYYQQYVADLKKNATIKVL